jgi:hypothetical protein
VAVVVVMAMMMVMTARCESRAGSNQQQEGGDNELLHVLQRSMNSGVILSWKVPPFGQESTALRANLN